MEEKEVLSFEEPEKPEMENVIEILPNTEEFDEPEKARAIIQNLSLSVRDTIKQSGEEFIINPRMVLEGDSPKHYKDTIDNLKKILTKQERKVISSYIKRKREDKKVRDNIYYTIEKRINKFYWRGDIKKSLPEDTKKILEFFKGEDTSIYNTIFHLLEKEKKDYRTCYLCAWGNKPIPNIQEWSKENDGEYKVLIDSEADYQAREYLEDDDYNWKCAVESGNTTEGLEDWADSVLKYDGRGSILNHYDGSEEYEEVDGVDYYIYRTN